jgi:hypothetical protein
MKLQLTNDFHGTTVELALYTSNREVVRLDGRRFRRVLDELCGIGGCDCLSDLRASIDGTSATILWADPDAEDDRPGIEIALPAA